MAWGHLSGTGPPKQYGSRRLQQLRIERSVLDLYGNILTATCVSACSVLSAYIVGKAWMIVGPFVFQLADGDAAPTACIIRGWGGSWIWMLLRELLLGVVRGVFVPALCV